MGGFGIDRYITSRLIKLKTCKVEESRADQSSKKGKGPKKQATKYDLFDPEEERYLVKLWVSYPKGWRAKTYESTGQRIVDELNAKFNHSRNVEK